MDAQQTPTSILSTDRKKMLEFRSDAYLNSIKISNIQSAAVVGIFYLISACSLLFMMIYIVATFFIWKNQDANSINSNYLQNTLAESFPAILSLVVAIVCVIVGKSM